MLLNYIPVLVYKDFIKQLAYNYKELMLQPSWDMNQEAPFFLGLQFKYKHAPLFIVDSK